MRPVLDPLWMAAVTGGTWTRLPAAPVRAASHDTRLTGPGDLFVALAGEKADGHAYVARAFEQGAAAALVKTGWAAPAGAACLAVPDPLAALQTLAAAHRHASDWRIVGITGSAGKSTVKEMTACLLESRWPTARTRGNWNNNIGLPLSLLTLAPGHHRCGVFETGTNHPGEIAALAALLKPDWGVVTNVGPVHVEFFKSVEGVAREKAALLESLPPGGLAVISRDTLGFDRLAKAAPCRLLTASLADPAADLFAEAGDDPGGESQALRVRERGGGLEPLRLPVPGRHNALNALLACLVAREAGLDWDGIRAAFAGYRPMRMRWQAREANGILVINDAYNANPLSMAAALQTFRNTPCAGRKWLVLGEMRELGELSESAHAGVGEAVADGPWHGLVVVGEKAAPVADRACALGFPGGAVTRAPDAEAAAVALKSLLRPGDAVLLKASRGVRLETVAKALGAGGEDA
jgi:UDP-N-acetylmuramoyl-tripeptide--D-alanyl-D-alanine ligase